MVGPEGLRMRKKTYTIELRLLVRVDGESRMDAHSSVIAALKRYIILHKNEGMGLLEDEIFSITEET